mmetsp:Transcript_18108/g.46307  ORF Transcript_18108/g.46307 Transcript_18108/m.46307 type:complete len:279 (+) Transcript_18108:821-1657(+)
MARTSLPSLSSTHNRTHGLVSASRYRVSADTAAANTTHLLWAPQAGCPYHRRVLRLRKLLLLLGRWGRRGCRHRISCRGSRAVATATPSAAALAAASPTLAAATALATATAATLTAAAAPRAFRATLAIAACLASLPRLIAVLRTRRFVVVAARRTILVARCGSPIPRLRPRSRSLARHLDADLATAILLTERHALVLGGLQRLGRASWLLEGHVAEPTGASSIVRNESIHNLAVLLKRSAQHLPVDRPRQVGAEELDLRKGAFREGRWRRHSAWRCG